VRSGRLFHPPPILSWSSSLSLVPCSPLAFVLDTQVHATAMHELVHELSLGAEPAAPFLFASVHCDPPCRPPRVHLLVQAGSSTP
jgi:hypothetical protein